MRVTIAPLLNGPPPPPPDLSDPAWFFIGGSLFLGLLGVVAVLVVCQRRSKSSAAFTATLVVIALFVMGAMPVADPIRLFALASTLVFIISMLWLPFALWKRGPIHMEDER